MFSANAVNVLHERFLRSIPCSGVSIWSRCGLRWGRHVVASKIISLDKLQDETATSEIDLRLASGVAA